MPVSVRGGSAGIEAHYDEIVAMARRFGAAATDSGGAALSLHGSLASPAILASAPFDPVGLATFEADLLDALDGPRGLTWVAARCGMIDIELRAAATAYQEADRLGTALEDQVGGIALLGPSAAHAVDILVRTRDVPRSLQSVFTEDPALVDELMNSGLISVDAVVAPLYADGSAKVTDRGVDTRGVARTAPRNLADVMTGLALRSQGASGDVDVRIMTSADGTRRAIVDIPGTKTFDPTQVADITGPATNIRALVGVNTAYEDGVLQAMKRAGVRPDDDVMLVGHSEGGMVAVQTALACARTGRFRVSHVVTAGSPVGRTVSALPARVRVLALENHNDVVPHLDGRTNPDKVNVTTVTVQHGDGTIDDDHSIEQSYLPGAADVDASRNRSVRSFLSGASGFFSAAHVETHAYVITRRY
jgi:pimeloyl-ACP methyl ester carboxylesterase